MQKRMILYCKKYFNSSYDISYSGYRDWLASLDLKATSKKSISTSIAKFLYTYELIDYSEYVRVRDLFKARVEPWSNKVLSDKEIASFFNGIMSMNTDKFFILRNLTLFNVMLITGMRIGQVLELTTNDISFSDEYITMQVQTSKKNDTDTLYQGTYILNIPNAAGYKQINLRKLLEIYLSLRTKHVQGGSAYIFCTAAGKPINSEAIRNLCRSFDFGKRITPHRFRHTAISDVALRHDLTKAAILANHTSIETTKRYVQTSTEVLDVYRRSTVDYIK
jgi:site-specific recombinase XerD